MSAVAADRFVGVKETAAALRGALRDAFPAVRFSVRMDRGSATGWLMVAWVDGPSEDAVGAVVRGFQSRTVDDQDDSWRLTGVSMARRMSPQATDRIGTQVVHIHGDRWHGCARCTPGDDPNEVVRQHFRHTDFPC